MMDSQLFKDRNLVEKDSKGRSWLRCPISGTEKISDRNGPAPKLGEHTTEVLNGLGFSERKIARLKKKGII
jgi:crotonobetainyl-CoA:carnitine CoA-transferase CaiB-like acyl-CoA transferase